MIEQIVRRPADKVHQRRKQHTLARCNWSLSRTQRDCSVRVLGVLALHLDRAVPQQIHAVSRIRPTRGLMGQCYVARATSIMRFCSRSACALLQQLMETWPVHPLTGSPTDQTSTFAQRTSVVHGWWLSFARTCAQRNFVSSRIT